MAACGGNETDTEKLKAELKEELKEEMQTEAEKEMSQADKTSSYAIDDFVMKSYSPEMAQQADYDGKVIHGEAWEDANGKNFVIFTNKKIEHKQPSRSIYLYAYHYADKGDGYKLMRKIQDHEEKCDLAMHAEFRLKTLEITDLDKDNKAEITFVYRLGCNGDPTPVPMKLMMLEDGEKYAIRGTTLVKMGPEHSYGGEMNVDASFKNAPDGFLEHAKKIWNSDKDYFNE